MRLILLPLESDGLLRVRCDGPITLHHLPTTSPSFQELLGARCFSHNVLLNLEGAESMDTSGLSWLMREHNQFRRSGGRLVLYAVPPSVSQLLEVLRLPSVLDIAPAEAEARALALRLLKPPPELKPRPTVPEDMEQAVRPPERKRPPKAV